VQNKEKAQHSILFFVLILVCPVQAQTKNMSYHEASTLISFASGDSLRALTLGNFQYTYHLDRTFWVGTNFLGGKTQVDDPNGLALDSSDLFLGVDGTFYVNIPALLGAKEKGDDGVYADLYTAVGVGVFWIGSHTEPYGFLGGGMLLHTPISWLGVRFDLKNFFYKLKNNQGTDFNSDLALSLGPSFLF